MDLLTQVITPVNPEEEALYFYVFLFGDRDVKCYISKIDGAIEKVQYMYQFRNTHYSQSI